MKTQQVVISVSWGSSFVLMKGYLSRSRLLVQPFMDRSLIVFV